jgi:nitrogen regulatory protein P-II 1
MKEISIVIPNARLGDLNQVLYKHESREVTSYEGYRTGKTVSPEFESRTKVEVVVSDSAAKEIVDEVIRSLSTGSHHDGKVFVKDIPEAYDIGTKETGERAL